MLYLRVFSVILAIFFTTSCGFKSVVVPNLDWIVATALNQNLHLNSEQKSQLQGELRTLFEKRKPQAEKIMTELQSLQLKKLKVRKLRTRLQNEYWDFCQDFVPLLSKYMGQLNSQQIQKFKATNREKNQEIEEQLKKGLPEIVKRFERFVGRLNKQQLEVLSSEWKVFQELTRKRLNRRVQYQAQIYELMDKKDSKKWLKIAGVTFDYNLPKGESELHKKSIAITEKLISLSDAKQEAFFAKTIKNYIEWIERFLLEDYLV